MLNTTLDADHWRSRYAEDARTTIDDFLEPDAVVSVYKALADVPFDYVYHLDGQNQVTPESEVRQWPPERRKTFNQGLVDQASEGVGFLYGGYRMDRPLDDLPDAMAPLVELYRTLNDTAVLDLIRTVTERPGLASASGQYTRYTPGQFLTRHRDDPDGERRQVAYVLSLTPRWHPDWGGLLQFYRDDGTPRDAWAPVLNRLALFDVRHVHAVTYVTPFARAPRLALTGWFSD